jgi:hypothetical protein
MTAELIDRFVVGLVRCFTTSLNLINFLQSSAVHVSPLQIETNELLHDDHDWDQHKSRHRDFSRHSNTNLKLTMGKGYAIRATKPIGYARQC